LQRGDAEFLSYAKFYRKTLLYSPHFYEKGSKFYCLARCRTKCTQDENLSKDFSAELRKAKFYRREKFQPLIANVCGAINSKLELQAGFASFKILTALVATKLETYKIAL
jgi:hypothetical protein